MTGIELIAAERQRQIEEEKWGAEHDEMHDGGELALAAASYAIPDSERGIGIKLPQYWPWDYKWWKPSPDNRIKELTKAGALIAAEIDRLARKAPTAS